MELVRCILLFKHVGQLQLFSTCAHVAAVERAKRGFLRRGLDWKLNVCAQLGFVSSSTALSAFSVSLELSVKS